MLRAALFSVVFAVSLGLSAAAIAQEASRPAQILTLNQERLYAASEFGLRVRQELEDASAELAAENRRIEAALVTEENRLTEERATMEPEAFRALAEDFDTRVTGIRRAQVEKRNVVQREADEERARFFELAYPVLFELVEETGALAILNQSAVILSSRQIDITEQAIERVNAALGAAPLPPEPPRAPEQRPAVESEDTGISATDD